MFWFAHVNNKYQSSLDQCVQNGKYWTKSISHLTKHNLLVVVDGSFEAYYHGHFSDKDFFKKLFHKFLIREQKKWLSNIYVQMYI